LLQDHKEAEGQGLSTPFLVNGPEDPAARRIIVTKSKYFPEIKDLFKRLPREGASFLACSRPNRERKRIQCRLA
jgi:hypothetical protein